MLRVLVVEDDTVLARLIADGLREHGMIVDVVHDGATAVSRVTDVTADVVVLDRDLPVLHGDDVTRALIRLGSPARILMLTAAASLDSRVEGLHLGADDYLAKPFAFAELIARVTALGRRAPDRVATVLHRGDLTVDVGRHEVRRGNRPITLTRKEFGVLTELLRADGEIVSAEHLLNRVWDEHTDPFTTAVRTTVKTLRQKLGDPDPISTVVGRGYRLA
ncbi:response regulator transcription factor [Dactylosporangium fulvum]|uniref:Response regulator transcription factor n=1 Tax=Dactylosporangium fulvum TaxID=53359 RepID=A0ABY5WDT7_9ACTN|nr:response regulator transcription factor [Dactylosporangium fulvum]UWP87586.1 response regulator transcription factor [Dactylosporangium fulvum]